MASTNANDVTSGLDFLLGVAEAALDPTPASETQVGDNDGPAGGGPTGSWSFWT